MAVAMTGTAQLKKRGDNYVDDNPVTLEFSFTDELSTGQV